DLMGALIKLWNGRRFAQADEVGHFSDAVTALRADFDKALGKQPAKPTEPSASTAPPSKKVVLQGDALARVEGAGVTFKPETGAIPVTSSGDGSHEILSTRADALPLGDGKRFTIEVAGTYAPVTAPLITPGEDLVVRVKYRATAAGELSIALRSLEEPDIADNAQTFRLAPNEKGSHEATLTPAPGSSGFYIAIGARGGA